MKLTAIKVGPFRSINEPQKTSIDPKVTVLVGMNEAGKTVILKALHKASDALGKEQFNITDDYPRKELTIYKRRHEEKPDEAVELYFSLSKEEIDEVNRALGTQIPQDFTFSTSHRYDNSKYITMNVSDRPVLEKLAAKEGLSDGVKNVLMSAQNIKNALISLNTISILEPADKAMIESLTERVKATENSSGWSDITGLEVWRHFNSRIPKFLYFSDYDLLPGKLNLGDLKARVSAAEADPKNAFKQIEPKHQAVLALLRMAGVDLSDFDNNTSYEDLKSQIEGVSINLTDQILEFWKQNEDLEVEIDIRADPSDAAPFNSGPNLYLRIKNRRHRGVSTPFDQRSRGFIWFFSFLVWFDSVQHQLEPTAARGEKSLILLLDEPALALHALAQTDFLRYIDHLAESHQVIYTTHSPFMVHSDRLGQVRVVEDKEKIGTVISDNLSGSDSRTIFPLQAALGWTLAQNLFITKANLLVEGISELSILQAMSKAVEDNGGTGLINNASIVPVGGLSNVATFVSLLGANGLTLAILHDYNGSPDQKIVSLIQQKLLKKKAVLNFSQFRDVSALGKDSRPTDVEDLFDPQLYLDYFNDVYKKELDGKVLKESDLPEGDRIVVRIGKYLTSNNIKVRQSAGYNHYAVAAAISTAPPKELSQDTIRRFTALFKEVNALLK
ncbi:MULTISPECIES: AAA family ATPase [Pseudomonas]|uniref:AAA family ATPase n=1 Tax=Pseudomonas TaxID=286 RepID=UPI000F7B81EC|nr:MULTISPECIES: AAA family ATPase [Pseudomonas]RRW43178.1 hypothetical protein EGJ50_19310 [Pseudomonas luteola]